MRFASAALIGLGEVGQILAADLAGAGLSGLTAHDVLRLVHGIVMATETAPQDTDRLLGMMLDGLRAGSVRAPGAGSHTG